MDGKATHEKTDMSMINEGIYRMAVRVLSRYPLTTAVYGEERGSLVLQAAAQRSEDSPGEFPQALSISASRMEELCGSGRALIIEDVNQPGGNLTGEVVNLPKGLGMRGAAYLPFYRFGKMAGVAAVFAHESGAISPSKIQPEMEFIKYLSTSLESEENQQSLQNELAKLRALNQVSAAISAESDLEKIYPTIHKQVVDTIGEVVFFIALYDARSEHISFPYVYEQGGVQRLDPIPLGEGLTSIVIRRGEPLMLVEDTEARALAMGAKIIGPSAKSWMGVPLKVQGEVIGIMALQDAEQEQRFDDEDLLLVTALADQMSGAIRNAKLLEQSQRYAFQLQTAAEIARETSATMNLNELLVKAIQLVKERFGYYHASVFLMDDSDEFAVVRESSGEAGRQMKADGHRLKKGSQSIIGHVIETGETLAVNDVSTDPRHRANPLLPETRAELGIALKVGSRILGAFDVQSVQPYAFSSEEIEVLEILADQLAIAVVNAELYSETQGHLAQHRMIHQITNAAASSNSLEEALRQAVQGLTASLGSRISILLLDAHSGKLQVAAQAGYGESLLSMIIEPGHGVTGWVAANRQTQLVNNVELDPRYIPGDERVRSELAVPLVYRDELLGVLNLESEQYHAYSQDEVDIVTTVAGSIAGIIANTRLWQRQRQLFEVTNKIRRSVDMNSIMETTATELNRVLKTRRVKVAIAMDKGEAQSMDNTAVENGKGV